MTTDAAKRTVYVKEGDRSLWQDAEDLAARTGESLSAVLARGLRAVLREEAREAGVLRVRRQRSTRSAEPHEKLEIPPASEPDYPGVVLQRFDDGGVRLSLGGRYMVRELIPGDQKTAIQFGGKPAPGPGRIVLEELAARKAAKEEGRG